MVITDLSKTVVRVPSASVTSNRARDTAYFFRPDAQLTATVIDAAVGRSTRAAGRIRPSGEASYGKGYRGPARHDARPISRTWRAGSTMISPDTIRSGSASSFVVSGARKNNSRPSRLQRGHAPPSVETRTRLTGSGNDAT